MRLRINGSAIESWPTPERGQITYSDDQIPGFICVVGKEAKTFFLQADVKGRTMRKKIGRLTASFSIKEARTEAMRLKAALRKGVDIFAKPILVVAPGAVTLRAALQDYLDTKASKIKARTAEFYRWHIEHYLEDWLDKPLAEIDRKMVSAKFQHITAHHGKASANNAIQTLSQIYNLAGVDDDGLVNPVDKFKTARGGLHEKKRRDGAIRPHDLPLWRDAIGSLKDQMQQDYFMLTLYTGLRRTEGATLQWGRVDFKAGTFHIPDTKNGKPLTLPMTRQVREILARRQEKGRKVWVFPTTKGAEEGHMVEPKGAIKRLRKFMAKQIAKDVTEQNAGLEPKELAKLIAEKISESSAARFYTHALRNTFISVARRQLGIDESIVKQLVNHAPSRDVTEGYAAPWTIDQLRGPAQRIADAIENMLTPSDNVVQLQPTTAQA